MAGGKKSDQDSLQQDSGRGETNADLEWERAVCAKAARLERAGDVDGALRALTSAATAAASGGTLPVPPPHPHPHSGAAARLLGRRTALLLRMSRWEAALESADTSIAFSAQGAELDTDMGTAMGTDPSPPAQLMRVDALLCLGRRAEAAAALAQWRKTASAATTTTSAAAATNAAADAAAAFADELQADLELAEAEALGGYALPALKAEAVSGPGGPRLSARHAHYTSPLVEVRSSGADSRGHAGGKSEPTPQSYSAAAAAAVAAAVNAAASAAAGAADFDDASGSARTSGGGDDAAAAADVPGGSGRGVFARVRVPCGSLLVACKALAVVARSEAAPHGARLTTLDTIGHRRTGGQDIRHDADAELPNALARLIAARPQIGEKLYSLSGGPFFDETPMTDTTRVDLLRISAISASNGFGLCTADPSAGGGGLWPDAALFNHSCLPNCTYDVVGDFMFVSTTRDVAAGEEARAGAPAPLSCSLSLSLSVFPLACMLNAFCASF